MPPVYLLEAVDCPSPEAPNPGTVPTAASPPVSLPLDFGSSGEDLVVRWNQNFAGSDMAGRSAGGVFGIAGGLILTAGTGLTLNISVGWAFIDGMRYRSATTAAMVDGQRNFVWLNQAGGVVVRQDRDAPAGQAAFLGSVVTAGGAITEIDLSGVINVNGTPFRRTADEGQPGDTPPSGVRLLTETLGGIYLWTGTAWVILAGGGGGGTAGVPSDTVAALDGTGAAGTATTYSRGDHRHADANRPTTGEKAALQGTVGSPSGSNRYVTDSDTRLTNARTPTAHASTHLPGGSDPLTTASAVGLGNANAAGTANSFARSDHIHQRSVRVQQDDVDVGTENALNFTGAGVAVTVDSTNGRINIDVTGGATGGPSPSASVAALDGVAAPGSAATFSRGDHKHADANRPADGEKAALAGTSGTPSTTNRYVTDADARNTNARTPTAHAATHLPDGSDALATAAAAALGDAAAAGTANSFARSDHIHPRSVRVAVAGTVIGTRSRLNFSGSGVSATDDAGNDEIDVVITGGGGGGAGTPGDTVSALDGTGAAGVATEYSRADHKHADANRPATGEKAALAGTVGTPGSGNKYVTDSDTRNTNARTPTAHAATHLPGGTDALTTAAPVGFGAAAAVGTALSFARSDHVHPRSLRVTATGVDAVRDHLNITGAGAVVTDDGAVTNSVTINVPAASNPSSTVAALDGTAAVGTASTFSRGDHKHADTNRPADGEKLALVGTVGTPGATNRYVTESDGRNTNARTPTAHAPTHLPNGSDPLATAAPAAQDGTSSAGTANSFARSDHKHLDNNRPSDGEKAALVGTSGIPGTGNRYVTDADPRNTNTRVPTAHAASHLPGGADALTVGAPVALDGSAGSGTANAFARSDHKHADANRPSDGEKAALQGTVGTPSNTNRYVTQQDSLLTLWVRNTGLLTPGTISDRLAIGDAAATPHLVRISRTGSTGTATAPRTALWIDSAIGAGDIDVGGGPDVGGINLRSTYLNTTAAAADLTDTGIDSRVTYGQLSPSVIAANGTVHRFTGTIDVLASGSANNEFAPYMGWARLRGTAPGSLWGHDMSVHGSIGAQPGALLGAVTLLNNYYNGQPSRAYADGYVAVTAPGQGAGAEAGHSAATTYPNHAAFRAAGRATGSANGWNIGFHAGGDGASPWLPVGGGGSKIGVGMLLEDLTDKAIQMRGANTNVQWGDDADAGRVWLSWPSSKLLQVNGRLKVLPAAGDLLNDPCLEVGGLVNNQANAIKLNSQQGGAARDVSLFVAGAADQFLTGTAAGDSGIRIGSAASAFHVGRGNGTPDVTLKTDGTLQARVAQSIGTDTNAARVTKQLTVSAPYNPPTIPVTDNESFDLAVAGVALGDLCTVSYDQPLPPGVFFAVPQVWTPGIVRCTLVNFSEADVDLPAGNVRLMVWRAS